MTKSIKAFDEWKVVEEEGEGYFDEISFNPKRNNFKSTPRINCRLGPFRGKLNPSSDKTRWIVFEFVPAPL